VAGNKILDDRRRQQVLGRAAAASGAVGLILVGIAAISHSSRPVLGQVLTDIFGLFGATALLTALCALAYERVLHRWIVAELIRFSGPSVLASLLPRQVMEDFLLTIYGDNPANHDVASGVLGGQGIRPGGADLSISTRTTVHYELKAQVPGAYELVSTVRYSFERGAVDHRLIIFATCDPRLRDLIASGCSRPLFDWWFVPDRELFAGYVDSMLSSVEIGIEYLDRDGSEHAAPLSRVRPTYVPFNKWESFLTFFREPTGPLPRQHPEHYIGTLRIYEYDLRQVEDAEHPIQSIRSFVWRSSTLQSTDDGFCYWQPPYPCFVEDITFDVSGLEGGGDYEWVFHVVPFIFRGGGVPQAWTHADEPLGVRVQSWMLPGHGVALLWKSLDDHGQ